MKVSEKDTFLHSIATFHSAPNRQPVAGNLKQILNYFKQLLKKKELFPLQGKIRCIWVRILKWNHIK